VRGRSSTVTEGDDPLLAPEAAAAPMIVTELAASVPGTALATGDSTHSLYGLTSAGADTPGAQLAATEPDQFKPPPPLPTQTDANDAATAPVTPLPLISVQAESSPTIGVANLASAAATAASPAAADPVVSNSSNSSNTPAVPPALYMVSNDATLLSLVQVPSQRQAGAPEARVIVRDMTGRYTWDASLFYQTVDEPTTGAGFPLPWSVGGLSLILPRSRS
jgi:hypothetical protein